MTEDEKKLIQARHRLEAVQDVYKRQLNSRTKCASSYRSILLKLSIFLL